ncbi:hypothetical protein Y1Q_0006295 [Alligator mississippiensis]|uniref:Uncharacterized protein n=1 Tax=Alligator mississippiensis TaxID=8496 RepID=A0A151NXL7_ALLMI|nr:hypothetical protein Y1Q_0006295 [Alligator mississippiensis]
MDRGQQAQPKAITDEEACAELPALTFPDTWPYQAWVFIRHIGHTVQVNMKLIPTPNLSSPGFLIILGVTLHDDCHKNDFAETQKSCRVEMSNFSFLTRELADTLK